MPTLRSTLDTLATSFAASVLAAIRGANLEELLADAATVRPRPVRVPPGLGPLPRVRKAARVTKSGRLKRRSPAEIAEALNRIVTLVKGKKGGLRAEQIRAALKMQAKEMPRILKEGLAKKKLKATGQKRATTYRAA